MARRNLLTAQDAQRKVLDQVVAVNRWMAQQRRNDEEQRRHREHRYQRTSITPRQGSPPSFLMGGGDEAHWFHATKKLEARAARSRRPNNTGFERLTATRSRTPARRVAIDERRATGAQVTDLVRELGLEGRLKGR